MTTDSPVRLLVMRHAKTETHAANDRERRLTERGVTDARAAGRWLLQAGLVPDLVLVSSAIRARQTVEHVAEAMGHDLVHRVQDELYGADVDDVLELCGQVADSIGSVMVVGHNPTMAELVHALQPDPDESWPGHLPTAGVAVVELATGWASIGRGSGRLTATHVSRG